MQITFRPGRAVAIADGVEEGVQLVQNDVLVEQCVPEFSVPQMQGVLSGLTKGPKAVEDRLDALAGASMFRLRAAMGKEQVRFNAVSILLSHGPF